MSLSNATHYYALENPPASYVGDFTVGIKRYDSSVGANGDALNVPLINGKLDRQAIIDFVGDGIARPYLLYDLVGSVNAVATVVEIVNGPFIYDNGVFSEDADSNIIISDVNADGNFFVLETPPTTGVYSFLTRVTIDTINESSIYGSRTDFGKYEIRYEQNGTSTFYSENFGSPAYFRNGSSFPVSNRGDAYNLVKGVSTNVLAANGTMPVFANNEFSITGSGRGVTNSPFMFAALFGTDESANAQTLSDEVDTLYASSVSGSVTFNDVAFSNGVVDFFSAPYASQGAITKVEQVPINSGVATMTVARDPLLDYFGVARGMAQDFSGTLASDPVGNVISTGLDLTGVNIGGVNDDHYIFRATGGTGAGIEVTVTDRTGGDITVTDASAFATGTEFTLGRFVSGISRILPKD